MYRVMVDILFTVIKLINVYMNIKPFKVTTVMVMLSRNAYKTMMDMSYFKIIWLFMCKLRLNISHYLNLVIPLKKCYKMHICTKMIILKVKTLFWIELFY